MVLVNKVIQIDGGNNMFTFIVVLIVAWILHGKNYSFEKMIPFLLLAGIVAFLIPIGSIIGTVFGTIGGAIGGIFGGTAGIFGGVLGGIFGVIGSVIGVAFGLVGAIIGLVMGTIGLAIGAVFLLFIPLMIIFVVVKLVR